MYVSVCTAMVLAFPAPARAQFQPRPLNDPATGETYHIEGAVGLWSPTAEMLVSSQGSGALTGIVGTIIDFKKDFGLQDTHFPELHLELKAGAHKLRFQYIPIKYDQSATITRDIVFNGQRYTVGLPVTTSLDWKAYRVGYEFDFIRRDRVYGGFLLDVKYTDVNVSLSSSLVNEFAEAKAPIPAIGGVVRIYVVPNISITGELTGSRLSWLPESVIKGNQAHYVDANIYGTLNFTNNIGVQVGYRSFDLGYVVNKARDTGAFTLKGLFFGVVARY